MGYGGYAEADDRRGATGPPVGIRDGDRRCGVGSGRHFEVHVDPGELLGGHGPSGAQEALASADHAIAQGRHRARLVRDERLSVVGEAHVEALRMRRHGLSSLGAQSSQSVQRNTAPQRSANTA